MAVRNGKPKIAILAGSHRRHSERVDSAADLNVISISNRRWTVDRWRSLLHYSMP